MIYRFIITITCLAVNYSLNSMELSTSRISQKKLQNTESIKYYYLPQCNVLDDFQKSINKSFYLSQKHPAKLPDFTIYYITNRKNLINPHSQVPIKKHTPKLFKRSNPSSEERRAKIYNIYQ